MGTTKKIYEMKSVKYCKYIKYNINILNIIININYKLQILYVNTLY